MEAERANAAARLRSRTAPSSLAPLPEPLQLPKPGWPRREREYITRRRVFWRPAAVVVLVGLVRVLGTTFGWRTRTVAAAACVRGTDPGPAIVEGAGTRSRIASVGVWRTPRGDGCGAGRGSSSLNNIERVVPPTTRELGADGTRRMASGVAGQVERRLPCEGPSHISCAFEKAANGCYL